MKLDDIPKKEIFTAPDGYFDKLPGIIQTRLAPRQQPHQAWVRSLRYAVPAVLLLAVAAVWYTQQLPTTLDLLAEVDTESLMSYLEETEGLTIDELLETNLLDAADAQAIEEKVYDLNFSDELLDALEKDNLDDLNSL